MRRIVSIIAIPLAAVLAACATDGPDLPFEPGGLESVVASLGAQSITVGQSTQAVAAARDASGNDLSGVTFTWSSSNEGVATVTSQGVVAGISAGTAEIRATAGSKTGAAVVTVVAAAQPPASGVIFADDFDSNRLSSYFEYASDNGSFSRQAGAGLNGSTSMRARWAAGQVAAGSLKLAFGRTPDAYMRPVDAGTANYREIYWRFWMKSQSGWQPNGNDKVSRAIVFAGSNWSEAAIGHVWGGSGASQQYLLLDPASGTDAAGTLRTTGYNDFANLRWLGAAQTATPVFGSGAGQWQCVEVHMRLNDAGQSNGVFEMWLNGAPEVVRNGLNWLGSYSAYGINALFLENFINNGAPQAQVRDYDNLVVSTQRIGCGSGPAATPSPSPVVATVTATLGSGNLAVGSTTQATAVARDANNSVVGGAAFTWSSTNPSVATVNANGVVTALAAGTAQITAASGGISGTAALTVTTPAPPPPAGNYTAMASDLFTGYSGTADLLANAGAGKPYCEFLKADGIALDQSVTYRNHPTVRVTQPTGSDEIPRLTSCFTSQNFWFRIKLRFSPGWTTAGSNANTANSFKMFGWWWNEGSGRGDLEITNTTSYQLHYSPQFSGGAFVSVGAGSVSTEWSDGGWYDYIIHYQVTGSGTRTRFWLARDGQAPVLRATVNGGGSATAAGIGFPFYFNQTVRSTQSLWIGQWEVVDGAKYAAPFGLQ